MEILYGGIPAIPGKDGLDGHSWWPEFLAVPAEYMETYYPMIVEGHANHLPVTAGGPWPSNWELSAYRATTVLRALTGSGVPEERISAAGYADTHPLVPVSDPAAVTTNRRVDVVVLSTASAEANALLPGIAKSRILEGTN